MGWAGPPGRPGPYVSDKASSRSKIESEVVCYSSKSALWLCSHVVTKPLRV